MGAEFSTYSGLCVVYGMLGIWPQVGTSDPFGPNWSKALCHCETRVGSAPMLMESSGTFEPSAFELGISPMASTAPSLKTVWPEPEMPMPIFCMSAALTSPPCTIGWLWLRVTRLPLASFGALFTQACHTAFWPVLNAEKSKSVGKPPASLFVYH